MHRLSPELTDRYCAWIQEHRLVFAKVARAFSLAAADEADLAQEMRMQVWLALPDYRGDARPSTWIYRICLNTALAWRRSAQRRGAGRHDSMVEAEMPSHPGPNPGDDAAHRDLLASLYAAIRQLPDGMRALVLLHLDGLAYEEIAGITGMSANHVGVALTRARKRLAALMKGAIDEVG